MKVSTAEALIDVVAGYADLGEELSVTDSQGFRDSVIDKLVYNAVFADTAEVRGIARWMIKSAGLSLGLWLASIQGLYEAMGIGEVSGYTVPAVNIRGMTYDVARALVRSGRKNNSSSFIFEIAKSEIEYTRQRPAEYSAVVIAAAIKEGHTGPLFIQGDHFQISAKKYSIDPIKELGFIKDLIKEAIIAGFYNIDIDTSTLVDLSKNNLEEQQRQNFEVGAELTKHVRSLEPENVTISIGGEIGEVGEKNSTVNELVAYMDGYTKVLLESGFKGISKVSVQTGTSHGGVPLPDGSIANVAVDFDTLDKLGQTAREKYGLSGAVQHGASTLPDEMFDRFPKVNTSEIHLATGFQNILYDSSHFPSDLKEKIYKGLVDNFSSEHKDGQTEEQFIYKTRKKGFGLAKEEIWMMPEKTKVAIGKELERKFDFLFLKLGAINTDADIEKYIDSAKVQPDQKIEISFA